jgi:hypothetical protein
VGLGPAWSSLVLSQVGKNKKRGLAYIFLGELSQNFAIVRTIAMKGLGDPSKTWICRNEFKYTARSRLTRKECVNSQLVYYCSPAINRAN